MSANPRHRTVAVNVGGVNVGGDHPIVVQSMTNTDTADVQSTVNQVMALAQAGLRTGARHRQYRRSGARRCPRSSTRWISSACAFPIIGDFHYNGHLLLKKYPDWRGRWPNTASIPATSTSARSTTIISAS